MSNYKATACSLELERERVELRIGALAKQCIRRAMAVSVLTAPPMMSGTDFVRSLASPLITKLHFAKLLLLRDIIRFYYHEMLATPRLIFSPLSSGKSPGVCLRGCR